MSDALGLFDLTGKVAVVTGGTRGIGLMAARGLLQAGAKVYVSSRKADAGEQAVRELEGFGSVASLPADVSSEDECLRLAALLAEREEGLHIAPLFGEAPLQRYAHTGACSLQVGHGMLPVRL